MYDAIFADIWVEFNAGTDNRAKNTYPYIFGLLTDTNANGKPYRWRWRHDDTDTIFDITNQGQALKPYYAEVYDAYTNGQPVWNGETSVFWDLIERAFADRKKELAKKFMDAMATLSEKQGTAFEKLFAFYDKYYFSQAQKYFPETIYNADVKRTYETAKLAQIEGRYSNDTDPLTQSLGDHYSAEKRWISRRIIYMMSKYSWGMFSAENTDGVISVRASGNNITYTLTPSMWLYPAIANGTTIIRGERTEAGQPREMVIDLGGSSDQQNNIMGANYLLDIGDWHDKSVSGTMTISGKMLRNITLGNDDAVSVIISISALNLGNIAMLETIKLSNISTLSGTVDLRNAGRIKEIYADGTSITQIKLPSGSDLTTLSYGASNQYIVLNNQKQLTSVDYSQCKEAVTTFAVSDCPNLDAFSMLVDIINAQNQAGSLVLKGVRLQGINYTSDSSAALETLAALANSDGFFGVDADGNPITGTLPQLSGKITINGYAYEDSVNALREAFPNLTIEVTGYYIRFEDPEVLRVLLANGVGDGVGITEEAALKCTDISTWFKGNTTITKFNELPKLGVTSLAKNAFDGCTALVEIDLAKITSINSYAFNNCSSLQRAKNMDNVTTMNSEGYQFYGCSILQGSDLKKLEGKFTIIPSNCFNTCSNLTDFDLIGVTEVGGSSFNATGLTILKNIDSLETIGENAFRNSVISMDEIYLPNVVIIHSYAFLGEEINVKRYRIGNKCTNIGTYGLWSKYDGVELIFDPNGSTITSYKLGSNILGGAIVGKVVLREGLQWSPSYFANLGLMSALVLPQSTVGVNEWPLNMNPLSAKIYLKATTPPSVTTYAIDTIYNTKVYIPTGYLDTYKAASGWAGRTARLAEYDFDADPDNINQYCV